MNYLNNTITIDPGLNTGYALWVGTIYPVTFISKFGRDELKKHWDFFSKIVRGFKIKSIYIEDMQTYSSSSKSLAATFRGDLFLVQSIAAGYAGIASQKNIEFNFIKPCKWKGQLPDNLVDDRIRMINGKKYPKHISSAVGIGFSIMGLL